ncbi:hypothetical protein MHBO_003181 [Bonamia ostreae]|uniref:Uncharacterized protein n=1 Tax=Bonamia ostreae TaxID=126728 RepID=A0ABV2APP7_9EUKA
MAFSYCQLHKNFNTIRKYFKENNKKLENYFKDDDKNGPKNDNKENLKIFENKKLLFSAIKPISKLLSKILSFEYYFRSTFAEFTQKIGVEECRSFLNQNFGNEDNEIREQLLAQYKILSVDFNSENFENINFADAKNGILFHFCQNLERFQKRFESAPFSFNFMKMNKNGEKLEKNGEKMNLEKEEMAEKKDLSRRLIEFVEKNWRLPQDDIDFMIEDHIEMIEFHSEVYDCLGFLFCEIYFLSNLILQIYYFVIIDNFQFFVI